MDRLLVFPVLLLGVVSCSQDQISGSVLNLTVRPRDNITLYCDCKRSPGVFIVWYRNCSHENQPPLVLGTRYDEHLDLNTQDLLKPFPRFRLFLNQSSESYDLRITSVTDSDEGLYHCGTKQKIVEKEEYIISRYDYNYGNLTTRIIINSSEAHHDGTPQDSCVCWSLLFSLCAASAAASSLLSSLVVYHLCKKKAKEPQVEQQIPDTRGQTKGTQDEDVCYAALEIRQASQRPKKKKTLSSDFSTYSAINTSRM